MKMKIEPVLLLILDGWGIPENREVSAVDKAGTPFLNELAANYPQTRLLCSGRSVGLPDGVMGNSEVGHLNIGAGRVVYQDIVRIDTAIENGEFFDNNALCSLMDRVKAKNGALHFMGLVSDGGVHSHLRHLCALLEAAKRKGLSEVHVHAITDGRDTAPDGGLGFVKELVGKMAEIGVGRVATVCGRYYAMDRDKRWERTEKAYDLYTRGDGHPAADALSAVQNAYDRGETDAFILPTFVGDAPKTIRDNDGVFFFNFRADRARQITRAFTDPDFDGFSRKTLPTLCGYVCMTEYDASFGLPLAFGPQNLKNTLGEVVAAKGLSQLRIAETEKYAHVTYFFSGGREEPFEGEDRCLVPSPRDVPTYDHKPAMSAVEVTDKAVEHIEKGIYSLIVLNFANMDMVGHTGVMDAAVQAVKTVDQCAARVVRAILDTNGSVLVTADHGNAEKMLTESGRVYTAHTTHPVRLILADDRRKGAVLKEGVLGNIAPTILDILGIEPPPEMTCESLLAEGPEGGKE